MKLAYRWAKEHISNEQKRLRPFAALNRVRDTPVNIIAEFRFRVANRPNSGMPDNRVEK